MGYLEVENMIKILTNGLKLEIYTQVYDGPSAYNAIIYVSVESKSFSAKSVIDSGALQIESFKEQIVDVYDNLRGEAVLKGLGGQKLVFIASKTGHIKICGELQQFNSDEDFKLSFSVEIDQSDLKQSIDKLKTHLE